MNIEDPMLREQEVNKLRTTADSYAPEITRAGGLAASTALPAAGIRKLHNMQQYSPEEAAKALLSEKGQARAILNELEIDPNGLTWRGMVANPAGQAKLVKILKEHDDLGRNFLGNVKNDAALRRILGDNADMAMSRGFKGRPFRGAGAMGLLGMGAFGLHKTLQNYQQNQQTRTNAQRVLQNLIKANSRTLGK